MMDKKTKRAHLGNHSSTGSVAPTLTPTSNNAAPNFLPGGASTTPLYHHNPYAHHPHANPGAAAGIFLAAGPGSGPGNHLNLGPATLLAYNMPSPYYPSGAAAAAAHLIGQPFGLGAVSATLLPNNSSVMTSFTAPRLATPQHSALYHFPTNAATALFPIYNPPPPPNYKTITPVAGIAFAPSSYAGANDTPSSGLQNNGLPPPALTPASTTTTPNQDVNSVSFGSDDVSGGYGARGKQVNGNAAGSTPPINSNNLPNSYYQPQQVNQQQHNVGPLTGANNIAAGYHHHHQQQYTSGPIPGSQPIMMSVAMLNGAVGGNLVSQQSSPSAFVGAGVSSSPMIANNGSLIYNNSNPFVIGPYATTNGPGALRQGIARNNGNGGNNQMDVMVGSMMAAASTYNNNQHLNKKHTNNAPVANYYYINGPLGGGVATSYAPVVSHAPAYNLTTPPLAAAAAALKYTPTATSDSQASLGIGEALAMVNAPLPPTSYMANDTIPQQMASVNKEGLMLPFYDSVKKGSSSKIHISDTSGKVYSAQDLAKDENVDSARATEFREAVASKAREPENTTVDHDAVKAQTELVADVQQTTPLHMDKSAEKSKISKLSSLDTTSKEIPVEKEGEISKLDNQPAALQEPVEVYKNVTQAAPLDKSAAIQAVVGDKTADNAAAEAHISDGKHVIIVDPTLNNETAAPVISITVPQPITIKENRVTTSNTIKKLPMSHEPVVLGVKGEAKPDKAKTDDVPSQDLSIASLGRESPVPAHIETAVKDDGTPRLMEMDFHSIKPKPVHQGVYKYSKDELFAIRQMLDISYFPPILRSFPFFSFDNKNVTIGAPSFNKRQLPNGLELNRYPFGNAYNRPSGRDFPPAFELPSAQPKIELTASKNAWVSLQQRRSDMDSEKFAVEELLGKVKAILNKMAPNNFAVLLEDFKNVSSKIDTQEKVQGVVAVIFKKALLEPIYAEAYAVFLRALANFCSQNQTEFKPISLLLAMSQKEFYAINNDTKGEKEKEWEAKIAEAKDENAKKILEEDYNEFLLKGRDRYLGNIKFLSELYKQTLISSRILCDCLQILFNAKTEIAYEGMCNLMRFAGKAYSDSVVERGEINIITGLIASMRELIKDKSIPSRIKFMMVDILELEENKWVPRRDEDLPKTFEQINKEIARENEENKKIAAANSNKKFYKHHQQQRDYNRPDSPVISPMMGANSGIGGGGNAFDAGKILASRPSSNLQRAQAFNIDGMKLAPTLRWGRGSSSGSKNQSGPTINTHSPTTTQGGYKSTVNERLLLAPRHLAPATLPPSILAKNSFGALASSGPLSPSSLDPTSTDDFIPASLRPSSLGGNINKRVTGTSNVSSAPPLVKTVYSHEEAVQKYKSCLKSYFITNVDQDYIDCCQTLRHQPTPLFACDQILHFVFDQHAAERDKYAGALLFLVRNKICPLEHVVQQMSDFLQNPEDILEDYPLLFQYLAHIVIPLALNAPAYGVSMEPEEFVVRYLKPLLKHLSNEERKTFIHQLIDYLQSFAAQSSTTFSSDVVDSYRLAISNLSPTASSGAEQRSKSNHPFHQRLQQLLFASAASDDQKLYNAIAEETRSYLNSISSVSDDVVDSRIIPELTAALDCALSVGVGTGEPSVARAQKILDIVSNAIDDTTKFGHENKRRLRDAILKLSATNNITRLDNDTTPADTQETTRPDPLTASS